MNKKILSFVAASATSFGVALSIQAMNPSKKVEVSDDAISKSCNVSKIASRVIIDENEFLKFSKKDNDRNLLEKFLKRYSEISYWDRGNAGILKFYSDSRKDKYLAYIIKNYKDIKNLRDIPSAELIAMKKPFGSEKIPDLRMNFIFLSKKYISKDCFVVFEDKIWMVACTTDFWNSTALGSPQHDSQIVCDLIDEFIKLHDFDDASC